MNRNVFVNIFRNYLVSIHRFFYLYIKWEKDATTQTIVVFMMTVLSSIGFIDSYFINPLLKSKSDVVLLSFALFFLSLPLFFWYQKNKPSESELRNGNGAWIGIVVLIVSIILLAFYRKFYF